MSSWARIEFYAAPLDARASDDLIELSRRLADALDVHTIDGLTIEPVPSPIGDPELERAAARILHPDRLT